MVLTFPPYMESPPILNLSLAYDTILILAWEAFHLQILR